MTTKQPQGTLRALAEKIQRSIAEAEAAEESRTSEWKKPSEVNQSLSVTREKIRQANDL